MIHILTILAALLLASAPMPLMSPRAWLPSPPPTLHSFTSRPAIFPHRKKSWSSPLRVLFSWGNGSLKAALNKNN
jgi:hypothetical protein